MATKIIKTNESEVEALWPRYKSKDEYIQKDLERQFEEADTMTEIIDILEQAKYFMYSSLLDKFVAELEEEERIIWEIHLRGGKAA